MFESFVGGHKVAKILYIAIYSHIFTMVKPYIHHGENTDSAFEAPRVTSKASEGRSSWDAESMEGAAIQGAG